MYGKEENKQLRQDFWTGFGKRMQVHQSARGPKQRWVNYRTGVKAIFFRMEADRNLLRLSIDLQHKDKGIRQLFFEQWEELKTMLHSNSGHTWAWEANWALNSGTEISRIYVFEDKWSIYRKEDWEMMWNWLQELILTLDELWADAIDLFKDLSD